MFVRIVKMDFKPENVPAFLEIFHTNKSKIRDFSGCRFLELYRDKNTPNIFFTYSYWEDEDALENYRTSDLFTQVWSKTRLLFQNKTQAWSVDKIESLK
ncbi:MAG: antibiotic biosynthesis monooxygenase [Flavobacteriales bacterium]|nr:antibiotic biosynthesis monooxygenase [Flavobacteriales bacterium]